MDEFGEFEIPIQDGKHLTKDIVGEHLKNCNSVLMLSHFKGHAIGGFGGALKNMILELLRTMKKLIFTQL